MSFCRFPVSAFAAVAIAGLATAQTTGPAAAADDNKPALEAIPAAEKEKMDAESDFIKALIEATMPDLAAPVIAHVVESAQFAFLSRDHMTIESPQMPFSTYTPGTLFFIR